MNAQRIRVASLLLIALALTACGRKAGPDSPNPWPKDVLAEVARIPVLADGRIKPLDTWASFALLRMNGVRSCRDADNNVLSPKEWALDTLFRPGWARQHRCFLITTDEVLDAIDLKVPGKKKRDRYTFEELRPGLQKLSEIAPQYLDRKAQDRSPLEEGLVRLLIDVHDFTSLMGYMDFTRSEFRVEGSEELKALAGGDTLDYTGVMASGPVLFSRFKELVPTEAQPSELKGDARAINDLLGSALKLSKDRRILRLFPPIVPAEDEKAWYTLEHLGEMGIILGGVDARHLSMLKDLESVSDAAGEPAQAIDALASFGATSRELAGARGEYEQIEREVYLYSLDPFQRSLYLFIFSFIVMMVAWLMTGPSRENARRWMYRVACFFAIAGLALLTYGVVLRCIIRSRPPVTGLYDTILFITGVAVLSCLVIEWFDKSKMAIALALAPLLGAVGMFIAARYEVVNRDDTMPRLQAVLDTNFWLTIHVLCIAIGYSAALLAGVLAHVYVLRRFFQGRNAGRNYGTGASIGWTLLVAVLAFWAGDYFGSPLLGIVSAVVVAAILVLHFRRRLLPTEKPSDAWYHALYTRVYGVLCFALLFSLVGTILGGVWANESWGRFWGWDPKENGALLICLSQLAILHSRMSGLLKAFGVCMAAIFSGMVVAFSWWGVNLLGIGLHSYGFTSGIWSALMLFYAFELLVLGAGLHAWLRDRKADPSVDSLRELDPAARGAATVE